LLLANFFIFPGLFAERIQKSDDVQHVKLKPGLDTLSQHHCTGSLLSSVADCPLILVAGKGGFRTGEVRAISQHCFTLHAGLTWILASTNSPGTCFIPKSSACQSDKQCQPSTFCLEAPDSSTCQHLTGDSRVSSNRVGTIHKLVQVVARKRQSMLEKNSLQARSGIFSVFLKKHLKPLLREIEVAFKTVGQTVYKQASGATMVFSGDNRFIVKKVREEEYIAMIEMLTRLNQHAGLENEQQCVSDACWAMAALGSTALSLPRLAFRDVDDPWFVMPTAASLRAYMQTDNSMSGGPYGLPVYYDVKPFWAASPDRPSFLRFLAEKDLTLDESLEWRAFQTTLINDANFLDSFKPPMVDYSLLFEVYRVDANYTQYPWTNCISSHSHSSTDIHLLCFHH